MLSGVTLPIRLSRIETSPTQAPTTERSSDSLFEFEYVPEGGMLLARARSHGARLCPPVVYHVLLSESITDQSRIPAPTHRKGVRTDRQDVVVPAPALAPDLSRHFHGFSGTTDDLPPSKSIWIACGFYRESISIKPGPQSWRGFRLSGRRDETGDGVVVDVHERNYSKGELKDKHETLDFPSFALHYHDRFKNYVDWMVEWENKAYPSGNRCFKRDWIPDGDTILEILGERGY